MSTISLHIDEELRSCVPELSTEEYAQLEQNMLNETKKESIVITTWHDTIIDGHKCYEICKKHNIEFTIVEKGFADIDDAKIFRIETHLGRRNVNSYVRARLVLELEELYRKRGLLNKQRAIKKADICNPKKVDSICQNSDTTNIVPVTPVDTKRELAKLANVSHDTIARVKKIQEKATPEQKQKLESGEASINEVYNQIKGQEADAKLKTLDADETEFQKTNHEVMQKVARGRQSKEITRHFLKQMEKFLKQISDVSVDDKNLTISMVRMMEGALIEALESR